MKTPPFLVALVATFLLATHAVGADNAAKPSAASPERLILPEMPGYKIANQSTANGVLLRELAKDNETVQNWTELVTVHVFPGGAAKNEPVAYATAMDNIWKGVCAGASSGAILGQGAENGYTAAFFAEDCPKNPKTGQPEHAMMKAIRGADNFYVVQKSWRTPPTKAQVALWSYRLGRVSVCDPRRPDAPCPKPSAPAKGAASGK